MDSSIDPHLLPITAYFDNSCLICREEIAALELIDSDNVLILIDCSSPDFSDDAAQQEGLTSEDLKAAMHVHDVNGKWYKAIDAFVIMYGAVGFDSAAALLQKRGFRPMFDWAYPLFLKHRYKLRYIGAEKLMPWLIRRAAAKAARGAVKTAESDQASPR